MKHIIIAPNSFKNSLNALAVAEAIEKGLKKSSEHWSTKIFPIADGGDYTLEVLTQFLDGEIKKEKVQDPLGREIEAAFGLIYQGKVAIIEYAKASGIELLDQAALNPMQTSSYGTGQLIKAALNQQVDEIWLGVGGSATVEGGAGLLQALGLGLFDQQGKPIGPGGKGLSYLHHIELDQIDPRLKDTKLKVLCDVDNTLLGDNGAARVFGPQKGADQEMVEQLEQHLTHFDQLAEKVTGRKMSTVKHGGAAGGVPAALYSFLGADLVNGIEFILDQMQFDQSLLNADLLITAEGKLDEQTLQGKGPAGVAKRAKQFNVPVIALGGAIPPEPVDPGIFDAILAIAPGPQSLEDALQQSAQNLERTAWQIGNLLVKCR